MISTLGWRSSVHVSIEIYIWDLSYKVPELFHQGIIFLGKIAGMYSTSGSVSARRRMIESMRHWLAVFKKKVREQSSGNIGIRGVIKKVARIHIMDSSTSRCWEPRRHQLGHAPYSSQMHSRSS